MSSKTKIIVLHMKEIIYTIAFLGLGILLVFLFFFMFHPKKDTIPTSSKEICYTPGVYSEMVTFGNQQINVEVCVDDSSITSIELSPLNESVETMYPLVRPAFDSIREKVIEAGSIDEISAPENMKYTADFLLRAIQSALKKAEGN